MSNSLKKIMVIMALSFFSAITSFAEEAPVYDADNLPAQFDGQPDALAPKIQTENERSTETYQEEPRRELSTTQRLAKLEEKSASMTTLSSHVESMQNEIQTLRGQVEELTHQLQQMQNQQKAMYSDLDKRITESQKITPKMLSANNEIDNDSEKLTKPKKSEKNAKKATQITAKIDSQPNVAEEQQIYQTAYNLIKAKKYNEAVLALKHMLQSYPSGQFAANAHYWLGELYGLMGKNDQSAQEFATVVSKYSDSPKIADAQVKLGLIYASELRWSEAKSIFKKVISKFPGSTSAHLASEQLRQIRQTGH